MRRRVFAEFRKGGVPDWALAECERRFAMAGKPVEIPAKTFLSTYDPASDRIVRGWTDEEYELILAKLRSKRSVVEIQAPGVEVPWPAYKQLTVVGRRTVEHVVEKILEGIETTGVSPDRVLAYEQQELNRPEVVAALKALIAERAKEDEAEPLIAA